MSDPTPSHQAERARRVQEVARVIKRNYRTYQINQTRMLGLLTIAKTMENSSDPELAIQREDLLRAVVVYLHATVEELLRGLALVYLPSSSPEILNKIPLAGAPDALRPEKFLLGRLASHRGRTIDEVIMQSVEEHVARKTFNDTSEISSLLTAAGFKVDEFLQKDFREIDALMKRRHQIVHCADLAKGEQRPTAIDLETILKWSSAVTSFNSSIATLDILRTVPELSKPWANSPSKGDSVH